MAWWWYRHVQSSDGCTRFASQCGGSWYKLVMLYDSPRRLHSLSHSSREPRVLALPEQDIGLPRSDPHHPRPGCYKCYILYFDLIKGLQILEPYLYQGGTCLPDPDRCGAVPATWGADTLGDADPATSGRERGSPNQSNCVPDVCPPTDGAYCYETVWTLITR